MEIANKVGAAEIVSRVVDDLKDEAEQYRKMVMETIEKIMSNLGATDIDSRLEEQLIDGILYAFQEQTTEVCLVIKREKCYHKFYYPPHHRVILIWFIWPLRFYKHDYI